MIRVFAAVLVALLLLEPAAAQTAPAKTRPDLPPQGAAPALDGDDPSGRLFAEDAKEPWFGDLDGMIARYYIRVLVPHTKTHYFVDRGRERGLVPDQFRTWEADLNKRVRARAPKTHKHLQVDIQFIPVPRDKLLPYLLEGRGDIAAANLTITPERRQFVDFSEPLISGVREVVVTGPASPTLNSLDDLAGKEIYVRRSSSFWGSLERLNERFRAAGRPPMVLNPADENFESEDVLELLDAGVVGITVADEHIAKFWDHVFDRIKVRNDIVVAEGGNIALAFRKNSPKLKAELDAWVRKLQKSGLQPEAAYQSMLRNLRFVRNATSQEEMRKFEQMSGLFKRYGEQYDFDWLMVMAQAYQESNLNQEARSHVGAVGVMQLMPPTAAAPPISIADIEKLERNVHAGVKYMRFLADEYFDEPEIDPLNRALFGFAAYNAGPNRIRRLREEAAKVGLDPNQWFNNVELVVARKVGREPVQYVSNIYKYYVAYTLVTETAEARAERLRAAQRRN